MQVDDRRQRSQQRASLAIVHLEAGADERETTPAILDSYVARPGVADRVPQSGSVSDRSLV